MGGWGLQQVGWWRASCFLIAPSLEIFWIRPWPWASLHLFSCSWARLDAMFPRCSGRTRAADSVQGVCDYCCSRCQVPATRAAQCGPPPPPDLPPAVQQTSADALGMDTVGICVKVIKVLFLWYFYIFRRASCHLQGDRMCYRYLSHLFQPLKANNDLFFSKNMELLTAIDTWYSRAKFIVNSSQFV